MNPKSPSATRPLPDFKESAAAVIDPPLIRHRAVPAIVPIFVLENPRRRNHIVFDVGPWLSLVERLNGVQEVESSNLSGPISFLPNISFLRDIKRPSICYSARVMVLMLCFTAYPSKRILSARFIKRIYSVVLFSNLPRPTQIHQQKLLTLAKAPPPAQRDTNSINLLFTLRHIL